MERACVRCGKALGRDTKRTICRNCEPLGLPDPDVFSPPNEAWSRRSILAECGIPQNAAYMRLMISSNAPDVARVGAVHSDGTEWVPATVPLIGPVILPRPYTLAVYGFAPDLEVPEPEAPLYLFNNEAPIRMYRIVCARADSPLFYESRWRPDGVYRDGVMGTERHHTKHTLEAAWKGRKFVRQTLSEAGAPAGTGTFRDAAECRDALLALIKELRRQGRNTSEDEAALYFERHGTLKTNSGRTVVLSDKAGDRTLRYWLSHYELGPWQSLVQEATRTAAA